MAELRDMREKSLIEAFGNHVTPGNGNVSPLAFPGPTSGGDLVI
jgi:hypothetical protein